MDRSRRGDGKPAGGDGVVLESRRYGGGSAAGERVVGVLPRARPLRDGKRAWLEDALSKGGDPTPLRARALTGAGVLAFLQCDYGRAEDHLEQSLALYEELDDRRGVAEVTDVLGGVAREQGDYEQARALHEESLALSRELGDEHGIADSFTISASSRG